MFASPLIEKLVESLRCLPGVGPKSAQRMALYLLVRIELSASDGRLEIRIVPETPIPGGGQVILTRFIPHARVDIERGENAGQILDYVNIVSEWHNLGHWDGSGPAEIDTDLDGDEPGAVLVQAEGFGPVLAAERLP